MLGYPEAAKVAVNDRLRRLQRSEACDGPAIARDHDLLPGLGAGDEGGEFGLGLGDRYFGHGFSVIMTMNGHIAPLACRDNCALAAAGVPAEALLAAG